MITQDGTCMLRSVDVVDADNQMVGPPLPDVDIENHYQMANVSDSWVVKLHLTD